MKKHLLLAATVLAGLSNGLGAEGAGIGDVSTLVVIYAENRAFDTLYGAFPGANGLAVVTFVRKHAGKLGVGFEFLD